MIRMEGYKALAEDFEDQFEERAPSSESDQVCQKPTGNIGQRDKKMRKSANKKPLDKNIYTNIPSMNSGLLFGYLLNPSPQKDFKL